MFRQITVQGEARERGRQYGEQAAGLVRHSIASYARLFAHRCGEDWNSIQERAMAYVPVLASYAPDLVEEMRGIAEGAACELAEIVALNVRTELLAGAAAGMAHRGAAWAAKRNQAAGVPDHGECTTLAALPEATSSGTTYLAQTWDWTGDQRAACVLLRIESPGRPDILTVTEAGILAKIGVNSAGVGVALNILHSQSDGQTPGMAVHVLLRRVLETTSLCEAVGAAMQAPAAASSCVSVADASGRALSLEVTPNGVGVVEPQAGLLVHTNHCVADNTRPGECPPAAPSSSVPRYNRAAELLARSRGRIDEQTLIDVLRDHDGAPMCICRHPDAALGPTDRVESVTGVLIDVAARRMRVAAGLPCQAEFEQVGLAEAAS